MPDKITPGPVAADAAIREATCVHTRKIYDSCQSKDCIEELRLYPTAQSAELIDRAVSIKAGSAQLLYVDLHVQPVGFNRGFYTIDARFFYKITADVFVGHSRAVPICGLGVFDKRSILFGSESTAKVFQSGRDGGELENLTLEDTALPQAVIEAVDPIILSVRLAEVCEPRAGEAVVAEVPAAICEAFGGDLVFGDGNSRRVYVTLGQFSILRLERDSQLLMPVYDYCMPDKECACAGCDEDPCELFQQVQFPVDEFFPPNSTSDIDPMRGLRNPCCK